MENSLKATTPPAPEAPVSQNRGDRGASTDTAPSTPLYLCQTDTLPPETTTPDPMNESGSLWLHISMMHEALKSPDRQAALMRLPGVLIQHQQDWHHDQARHCDRDKYICGKVPPQSPKRTNV